MTNLHWTNPAENFNQFCKMKKDRYTNEELAKLARNVHQLIWNNKNEIWFDGVPTNPVEMIDPVIAAQLIGFKCDEVATLGQNSVNGRQLEVAGIINPRHKRIEISQQFSKEVRNFTAAHELGHAILHRNNNLHRDRPHDGSKLQRNETEYEADTFATAFLMPEKLIKASFVSRFLVDPFELNESTAFALTGRDYAVVKEQCKSLRQLSRMLAAAEYYNGNHLISFSKVFKVSVEAMAIRLEELGLVLG